MYPKRNRLGVDTGDMLFLFIFSPSSSVAKAPGNLIPDALPNISIIQYIV